MYYNDDEGDTVVTFTKNMYLLHVLGVVMFGFSLGWWLR